MKKLIIFAIFILNQVVFAKVDPAKTQPVVFPEGVGKPEITSSDIARVIPTDMSPTADPGVVVNKIGDKVVQNWLSSPAVKSSPMGRTANAVESAMRTEVTLQPQKAEGIAHRFSFQYLAFQSVAKMEYRGWLNAAMNYDSKLGQTVVELTEKLWTNKDLFVKHVASNNQEMSSVGLRWSW